MFLQHGMELNNSNSNNNNNRQQQHEAASIISKTKWATEWAGAQEREREIKTTAENSNLNFAFKNWFEIVVRVFRGWRIVNRQCQVEHVYDMDFYRIRIALSMCGNAWKSFFLSFMCLKITTIHYQAYTNQLPVHTAYTFVCVQVPTTTYCLPIAQPTHRHRWHGGLLTGVLCHGIRCSYVYEWICLMYTE